MIRLATDSAGAAVKAFKGIRLVKGKAYLLTATSGSGNLMIGRPADNSSKASPKVDQQSPYLKFTLNSTNANLSLSRPQGGTNLFQDVTVNLGAFSANAGAASPVTFMTIGGSDGGASSGGGAPAQDGSSQGGSDPSSSGGTDPSSDGGSDPSSQPDPNS